MSSLAPLCFDNPNPNQITKNHTAYPKAHSAKILKELVSVEPELSKDMSSILPRRLVFAQN